MIESIYLLEKVREKDIRKKDKKVINVCLTITIKKQICVQK